MFCPSFTAPGPVFTTNRSAEVVVVRLVFDVLLGRLLSVVVEQTLAMLLIVVPLGVAGLTVATTAMVADVPTGNVAIVSVITLPACPSVKAGPVDCDSETNVMDGGSVSLKITVWASLGPML